MPPALSFLFRQIIACRKVSEPISQEIGKSRNLPRLSRTPMLLGHAFLFAVTELAQRDFVNGTYRITTPGVYRLSQSIEFGPRAHDDYWNDPRDPEHPMGQYYLGFFAAITIETSNVEIDMNGHAIRMSSDFYLAQRFWNAIELGDRVFVDNEGVASLRFQEGDKLQELTGKLPAFRQASNVYIHDGELGLSAHAGIHGNGATNVRIERLRVTEFEVAGIQCNGCVNFTVVDSVVGPSSARVPALATFSNARFLGLYTQRFIPHGFAREGLQHLLDETISFADRRMEPPRKLSAVFARCERAVQLYMLAYNHSLPDPLSSEEADLLAEAHHIFDNQVGLPDGSVVYGILINHLGLPEDDENYYGAGHESRHIRLEKVNVTGLKARPVEVPALQTTDGVFSQGPARDLLRIFDVANDRFRSLVNAQYQGNFLADAYFAFWQLSNSYYVARVYKSECGNFGSNATMPYTLSGLVPHPPLCDGGVVMDGSLDGRAVSMLQKRYFGGLSISQDLFDWATSNSSDFGLHRLFISDPEFLTRRRTQHVIVCDKDTMFHPMQGVIGINVRWTRDIHVESVQVEHLINSGDDWHWVCKQSYKLPENEQLFKPQHAGTPRAGADVRGIKLLKVDEAKLIDVTIRNLNSDEGKVIGVDVVGDENDRSGYTDRVAVSFQRTVVTELRAGHGVKASPINMGNNRVDAVGVITGDPADKENNFRRPKAFVMYEVSGGVIDSLPDGTAALANLDKGVIDRWMKRSHLTSEELLLQFRYKSLSFFEKQFGLEFYNPSASLRQAVWVKGTDSYLFPGEFTQQAVYKAISICTVDGSCSSPSENSVNYDFFFAVVAGPSGLLLKGVFGGDEGKLMEPGFSLVTGTYCFENFTVPRKPNTRNFHVEYFSRCPIGSHPLGGNTDYLTSYIDCFLESEELGHGRGTAGLILTKQLDGKWKYTGYPTMVFEDTVVSSVKQGGPSTATNLYEKARLPSSNVAFHWIADGAYKVGRTSSGSEIFPYVFQHHFTHEAGIKFLKRWTSVNTDEAIRAMRYWFMTFLKYELGITKADPDIHFNDPLANQIDLGGGNHISPYVVNHWTNQRVVTKRHGDQVYPFPESNCRLHEGGFRLFVGRAGLPLAKWGYVPYGSLVLHGMYVIEGDPEIGTHEIKFTSAAPVVVNAFETSVMEQHLSSSTHGNGTAYIVLPSADETLDGLQLNLRGTFAFEEPAGCASCAIEGSYPLSDIEIDLRVPRWPQNVLATAKNLKSRPMFDVEASFLSPSYPPAPSPGSPANASTSDADCVPDSPEESDAGWKIALGVSVPLSILLGVLLGALCWKFNMNASSRMEIKSSKMAETRCSGSDRTEHATYANKNEKEDKTTRAV